MMLEYVGYAKLRSGRIHLFCLGCKRKLSNIDRQSEDPPAATLLQSWCEKCSQGAKDPPCYYLDADGRRVWACEGCGGSLYGGPGLCGECGCEDDGAIW